MIFFFGIPSLIILFIIAIASAASTRVCPYCAERIKKAATACRYCGRDVGPTYVVRPMSDELPPLDPGAPKPSRWPQAILAIILIGAGGALLYSQASPSPPGAGLPTPKASHVDVAAPAPMPVAPPFVGAPTGTVSSTKSQPKDAKPKAPAGPLRITPQ